MIADLVIPTPGLHVVAWAALVAGLSWMILFATIMRKNIRAAQPDSETAPATQGYTATAFLCLVACVFLSVIVDLGVVLSDTG